MSNSNPNNPNPDPPTPPNSLDSKQAQKVYAAEQAEPQRIAHEKALDAVQADEKRKRESGQ